METAWDCLEMGGKDSKEQRKIRKWGDMSYAITTDC